MNTKLLNEIVYREEVRKQDVAYLKAGPFERQLKLAASEGLLAGLLHNAGINLQTLELQLAAPS